MKLTIRWRLEDDLPEKYTDDQVEQKVEAVYQHVYDSHYGLRQSVYEMAG